MYATGAVKRRVLTTVLTFTGWLSPLELDGLHTGGHKNGGEFASLHANTQTSFESSGIPYFRGIGFPGCANAARSPGSTCLYTFHNSFKHHKYAI